LWRITDRAGDMSQEAIKHASEQEQAHIPCGAAVENNCTMQELKERVNLLVDNLLAEKGIK